MKKTMKHYFRTVLVQMIFTEKKEDTIISWRDPEFSTELALSFQETTGCSYIWDNICSVQRNMHFNTLNNETYHSVNSELRELPAVELSTLPIILKMSSSNVNGGTSNQLTYCNRNYPKCHKKATIRISETERNRNKLFYCCQNCGDFIGWCLPTNSQGRGEGVIQMENMPTVTEQQLRLMNEQLRFQSEELQFLRAKVLGLETDINQNSCRIYGLFILLVIGIVLVIKM
ncbi:unnamed protein product [Camellia sinensis]